MSKIDSRTTVTIGENEFTLLCTLDKCLDISRRFNGFRPVIEGLANQNVDVCASIVEIGLSADDKKKWPHKKIASSMLAFGIVESCNNVYPYVQLCQNGGREPDEPTEVNDEPEDEGYDEGNGEG